MALTLKQKLVLTDLEDPDNNQEDDDEDADDVEALLADPFLDAAELAVGAVDTLVDALVFTPVEERPDEVDTGGDDEERVEGDVVGVEADAAVSLAQRTPDTSEDDTSSVD